ncbi:MAG: dUTP diphosphatase [Firmicutes bacterium]|nr:dUTP diphosphatase [Bacillota bacterium]
MKQKIVELPVKVLPHAAGLPLPRYMSAGAAGMDLFAALSESAAIEPGTVELIPTGLQVAVPQGYELQIRPRSGLAARHGIGLLNSPGTVDADYRGEIKVILINLGPVKFTVSRGDRIAQMILCPIPRMKLLPTETLPETTRGRGGFGHTGIK